MENPLKLKRIHHVEFYVGNAKQASFYYRNAFGFSQVAYSGLETGNRQATSYWMRQDRADILLTTPLNPNSPASEHIRRHGDGVRDIALHVEDADLRLKKLSGAAPSPRSNRTTSPTNTEKFAAPPSRPTATRFTR
jgi:4-hydroxyphenylpyruvate dioxygenase